MDSSVIRVFVSSTFKDMQVEREQLVKKAFPQIRDQCRQRAQDLVEVDLRWGIPEAKEEEMLLMCLQQIDGDFNLPACDFLVGILGQKYGTGFEKMAAIREKHPHLEPYAGQSYTELEIRHWLYKHPDPPHAAFFYFRVSAEEKDQPEVAALKADLRAGGARIVEYTDPEELAGQVLADLPAILDKEFPPTRRSGTDQQIMLAARHKLSYVPVQDYFNRLTDYVRGEEPPLLVTGAPGSGKSALLANWSLEPDAETADLTIRFFSDFDLTIMLHHVISSIRTAFNIKQSIPEHPAPLAASFGSWLHQIPPRKRVVIILDGVDPSHWSWLPEDIPSSVRLILGVEPGPGLDSLRARGWPELNVGPLDDDHRREIIQNYFRLYGKQLLNDQLAQLCAVEKTKNPLFLRILLAEMRVFSKEPGTTDEKITDVLNQHIENLLQADDAINLYNRVLARYEKDYGQDLVRAAMRLIVSARRGLTESELLELLGPGDRTPLPQAQWSYLYFAAVEALKRVDGKLTFAHPALRQAVEQRYLPSEGERHAAHRQLAAYFQDRLKFAPQTEQPRIQELRQLLAETADGSDIELETAVSDLIGAFDVDVRVIEELPWQLSQSQSWDRLHSLLVEPRFAANIWTASHAETLNLWAAVEANTAYRLADAYRDLSATQNINYLICLANLLRAAGYVGQAYDINQRLSQDSLTDHDRLMVISTLANMGADLLALHQLDEANVCFERSLALSEELGYPPSVTALQGRADILRLRGDLKSARAACLKELDMARATGDTAREKDALDNLAAYEQRDGNQGRALELAVDVERLCRILDDQDGLQQTLGRQAQIRREWGEYDAALNLLDQRRAICEQTHNLIGLSMVMSDQAVIYMERGELDRALDLLKTQEALADDIGVVAHQVHCLANQAEILTSRQQFDDALELALKLEDLARRTQHQVGLARSLSTQARIMHRMGQFQRELDLLNEQIAICRRIGENKGLLIALTNKAQLLLTQFNNATDALDCANEACQLAQDGGFTVHLKDTITVRDMIIAARHAEIAFAHVGDPYPESQFATLAGPDLPRCRVCGAPVADWSVGCTSCGTLTTTRKILVIQWLMGSVFWFVIGLIGGLIAKHFGLHLPVPVPLAGGVVAVLYFTFYQLPNADKRQRKNALRRQAMLRTRELVFESPHVIDLPAAEVADSLGVRDVAAVREVLEEERRKRGL